MYDLLVPQAWFSWVTQVGLLLVGAVPGLLAYGALADQTVFEGRGRLRSLPFGRVDLFIGLILTSLFLMLVVLGFQAAAAETGQHPVPMEPTRMIIGTILSAAVFLALVGGILASLTARRISWRECFWPSGIGPASVLGRAATLLIVGLPLVMGAILLSRVLLAAGGYVDDSPQDIVSFLEHNRSRAAQWVVAVFAVVVAPMQEEFLFRGYLYGIMRRYVGPALGIVLNSLLFAAIHVHLPSFGGLFVLAVCLTLAYEWSGSIFVPMTMHALFNSLSVIAMFNGSSSNW